MIFIILLQSNSWMGVFFYEVIKSSLSSKATSFNDLSKVLWNLPSFFLELIVQTILWIKIILITSNKTNYYSHGYFLQRPRASKYLDYSHIKFCSSSLSMHRLQSICLFFMLIRHHTLISPLNKQHWRWYPSWSTGGEYQTSICVGAELASLKSPLFSNFHMSISPIV